MRFTEEMSKFLVEIVKENEEDLFPSSQKKDSRKTQEDAWKFMHSEITNQTKLKTGCKSHDWKMQLLLDEFSGKWIN